MEWTVILMLVVIGGLIFFLPTIIAINRNHPNTVAIAVVNVLGGLFVGIGWLVALVWSLVGSPPPPPPVSHADEIEKWADLKEKGLISESEYQAKKRALMKY
jgi:xanthine/uracil/vitamin C permease (AzgA family)